MDLLPAFALPEDEGTDKTTTLSNAIATYVKPGATVHVAYSDARPNAALLELARHFAGSRPGLRLVSSGLVSVQHALIELGIVDSVEVSFAGENYPMARPNRAFQRAISDGRVNVRNWSLWTLVARLMAGALGVSHLPVRSLMGSDMASDLLGTGYVEYDDPCDPDQRVGAVTALRPDVVLLQGVAADRAGNVIMAAPYGESMWGSLAARDGVIACVERIVHTDEIRHFNTMVRVPAHKVLAVCEVPLGSHPYGLYNPGFPGVEAYVPDGDFMAEVLAASKSPETFAAWIDEWVLGVADHQEYLAKLGTARIQNLREAAQPEAWRNQAATMVPDYRTSCTENELMVVMASRMISERVRAVGFQAVLAGVGLANLSAWNAVRGLKRDGVDVDLMAEIGMFGYDPRPGEPFIFANRNLHTSKWLSDVSVVLGSLVSGPGTLSMGVIGAAEIDQEFNTNSTYSSTGAFLVGSGGANDILSAVDEALVTVNLSRERLVPKVSYVTCPGDRVRTVVTSGGVFEREGADIVLTRYFSNAGLRAEDAVDWIRERCSWDFEVSPDLRLEPDPTAEELSTLRLFDPDRTFLRGEIVLSEQGEG